MLKPYELYVGMRYLRARSRSGFISFISAVSMLGICVGVAVLIVVLSVMNGFESELRERILAMASHATITGFDGPLEEWALVRDVARAHPRVDAAAPFVEGEGMLVTDAALSGVLVRGVIPEEEEAVAEIAEHMISGRLTDLAPRDYSIILGKSLAEALDAGVGDRVLLLIPEAIVTPAGIVPRMRRFTVSGLFEAGMHEFDRGLAFIHLSDAATLYRLPGSVTGVRLKLDDMFQAPEVVREIALDLGGGFYVNDWTRKHVNMFRSIKLTKTVMFVILLLVVTVAAFNIVSTLVMIVKDKQSDIAILRTLGASPRSIKGIFMVQGTVIGIVGTLLGLGLGTLVALNIEAIVHGLERLFNTSFLAPDVYYISDLPARLQASDLLRICGTAFILSLASTIYPARRAAGTEPAEVLRYE